MNSTSHPHAKLNSTITTNSIAPTPTSLAGVSSQGSSPRVHHVFKLGLDVDLHLVVTAIQCDHGAIKPAQKLTRAQLLAWVQAQVTAGHAPRSAQSGFPTSAKTSWSRRAGSNRSW